MERIKREWSEIAGEAVEVEEIGGAMYAFCSELAALRLFYKFRYSGDKATVKYSHNQETWFFRLEK